MKYIIQILFCFLALSPSLNAFSQTPQQVIQHSEDAIPVLNVNDYLHGDEATKAAFVQQVADALHDYGFFALENSAVDPEIFEKGFNSALSFFAQSLDVKRQYENLVPNRGYKSFNLDASLKAPDLQEYYHVGRTIDHARLQKLGASSINPNVWPDFPADFKDDLQALYDALDKAGQPILEACSLAMGEKPNFLSKMTKNSDSIMRVIHYLDVPQEQYQELTWKAPHKDPNLITFIYGISSDGLEIERPDGSWLKVKYDPNHVIVSGSNMLENLSNGMFKSTPHRVMTYRNQSRYAIPFFYHVRRELDISPRKAVIEKTGGISLFPSITAEESLEGHHWFAK